MIKIEHSVVINRDLEDVFKFLITPENNPIWQSGITKSRKTSDGPITVGSTAHDTRKYMGMEFETTYRLPEYETNARQGFKSLYGPIQFEGSYDFETVRDGTRFTFTIQGEPGKFSSFIGPLAVRMARKQVEADSANLKNVLERTLFNTDFQANNLLAGWQIFRPPKIIEEVRSCHLEVTTGSL